MASDGEPGTRGAKVPAIVACAALLVVVGALVYVAGRPIATDDLWWHLRMGEAYATDGLWPERDPLVHTTSGRPPIPHEWLFQVAAHGLDRALGLQALRVVHVAAVAAILALAFSTFRRAAAGLPAAALATAVFGALSWYRLVQLRPELLSILFALLLYRAVLARPDLLSWRTALAVLGLFVLWANAHSVFAVGLALLLAACGGALLRWMLPDSPTLRDTSGPAHRRRLFELGSLLLAATLITFLNPRGFRQHITFFQYSRESAMWSIEDDWQVFHPLQPLLDNPALSFTSWVLADAVLAALCVAVVGSLVRAWRRRGGNAGADLDPEHLALALAGVVAMITTIRFHWLSIFPLLYVLRWLDREVRAGVLAPQRLGWLSALASLGVAAAFPLGNGLRAFADEVSVSGGNYFSPAYLEDRYGEGARRFLTETALEGRVFNPYYLGGFVAYWHAPRLRTFIDGRMDHYPREVYRDYQSIVNASARGASHQLAALLDARSVDVFIAVDQPNERYENLRTAAAIRDLPGWIRVYQSHHYAIYLRRAPINELNLFRVMAYYRERELPFQRGSGLDVEAIAAAAPAWAFENDLLSRDHAEQVEALQSDDPEARLRAHLTLGERLWRIGSYEWQVEIDSRLLGMQPDLREPWLRVIDGLFQLGRVEDALELARLLYEQAPEDEEVAALYARIEGSMSMRGHLGRMEDGKVLAVPR